VAFDFLNSRIFYHRYKPCKQITQRLLKTWQAVNESSMWSVNRYLPAAARYHQKFTQPGPDML